MMRKFILGITLLFGVAAQAEEVTIAALGDSLTQGYGLEQQDGLVPQLATWLEAQGAEVRLINAGVSGDTTAGGLSRVGWTLTPDVDAMIVALGGNDLLRGLAPKVSRANIDGILAATTVPVLLVGMPAPGNFGPAYQADFDAIFPELSAQYETVLMPDFFEALREEPLHRFMQPDGIHPNREGVRRIVEVMGPYVLRLITRIEP